MLKAYNRIGIQVTLVYQLDLRVMRLDEDPADMTEEQAPVRGIRITLRVRVAMVQAMTNYPPLTSTSAELAILLRVDIP